MSKLFSGLNDSELVEVLLDGVVGVLPTDTIYGLVCRASDKKAVDRLYGLKSRDHKPGTIIAASTQQLIELGLKARYLKPVEVYWPGPVSVIIPCTFELPYLHLGVGSLAVRIVADKALTRLLAKTGPLLTSSANLPNQPEPKNMIQAEDYFGDDVDFYVDGGDLSDREASTLIRVVDDIVEVLREGAVKINEKGEIIS